MCLCQRAKRVNLPSTSGVFGYKSCPPPTVEFNPALEKYLNLLREFVTGYSDYFTEAILFFIIWRCLPRTGNHQIHEFDQLKWILTFFI